MLTIESNTNNGLIILWDLVEGKRDASMKPYAGAVITACFDLSNAHVATLGCDMQGRHQIIVWNIQSLLTEKNTVTNNSNAAIVARQISEFPTHKIRFSPFLDASLVSCGRENIRFWRIRKGHLPGRPVLLNEYARGYVFNDIAFHGESLKSTKDYEKPFVYVSSNKGLVLRINHQTDQILCAFQLHSGNIRSFFIHSGYAVTGADDNRLRIWPLDFSDFLLEARHEGSITNINVSNDGRKQVIGTVVGTLGILNVSEHR